jgi:hypothetical protein
MLPLQAFNKTSRGSNAKERKKCLPSTGLQTADRHRAFVQISLPPLAKPILMTNKKNDKKELRIL